ncbi:MAG: pilus assembly PilX N-terminal domain-containing protein [Desulfobacteraceae bacterium]|nr:pilus assembly PilX N-terminal domain-containing protein [Desulfobacteraceae bacterium]
MNAFYRLTSNKNGSALIIVMVVLVAATALSMTMINFTSTESKMAAHYKFSKVAFFYGDSGIYGAAKFIRLQRSEGDPIAEQDPKKAGCVAYLNTSGSDSGKEIRARLYGGFRGEVPDATESYNTPAALVANKDANSAAADISMSGCQIPASINVIYLGALGPQGSGGGAEFGTGSDGLGGGGGDQPIGFRLTSTGKDSQNDTHSVRAIYLWRKAPGGL